MKWKIGIKKGPLNIKRKPVIDLDGDTLQGVNL